MKIKSLFLATTCVLVFSSLSFGAAGGNSDDYSDLGSLSGATDRFDDDRLSFVGEPLDSKGYRDGELNSNERRKLLRFLYLYPADDAREADLGHRYAARYQRFNDYPFSLPAADREPTTLRFGPDALLRAPEAEEDREIFSIMQQKVAQIIVEDGIDVSALSALSGFLGGSELSGRRAYGLHLWGRATPELFSSFAHVIERWSGRDSMASLGHLDVALYGLEEGMRSSFMEMLRNILGQEASHGLKTLSLRFIGLNDSELNELAEVLMASDVPSSGGASAMRPRQIVGSRSLERLVLSFNHLTDAVMGEEGTIARLLGGVKELPYLHALDLRGNNFFEPRCWDLDLALAARRIHIARNLPHSIVIPSISIGYNGITPEARERGSHNLALLEGIAKFEEPADFTAASVATLRSAFSGLREVSVEALPTRVSPSWFTQRPYYPRQADVALVMAHGAGRLWEAVDLSNTRLTDGSSRSWLIRHIRPHARLKGVRLDRSTGAGGDYTADHHEFCVHLVNGLPSLERLSLADNSLAVLGKVYGFSYENLRALRYFSFAKNGLRLGGAEGAAEDPVRLFFLYQLPFLRVAENLRVIDISQNDMGDDGVPLLTNLLRRAPQVQYFDYSQNQFTLSDGANRAQLIERIGGSENLLLLDLSDNPISEDSFEAFSNEYERFMERDSAGRWPVVRLNARRADGSFTSMRYFGSREAMRHVASILDTTPENWGLERKPELALELSRFS
jgi:Leucine-rich repeat (LRR) protein